MTLHELSSLTQAEFSRELGSIFEHSPWVAERAFELELGPAHDSAGGLHNALARVFRSASEEKRLGVLTAHPDLAGKLAQAKRLTKESTSEQAGAGLDAAQFPATPLPPRKPCHSGQTWPSTAAVAAR